MALLYVAYNAITEPFDFGSAFVAAPLFLGAAYLLARGVGRREKSFDLTSIILAGAALRLLLQVPRYNAGSDAKVYSEFGKQLSASFRAFQFDVDTQREFPGTGFLRYLTGLVQVVTFDDRYATFLFFTAFSMLGATFFYLAFARGLPDGNRQRYAALVFLWPSMAYWPTSIGKEAWMIMGIGLASYGAALVLTNRTYLGFALVVAGIAGTSMVRPHVSVMVMAATAVGILVRKPQSVTKLLGGRKVVRRVGSGAKILAVVLVLLGGGYLATQTQKVLKLDDSGSESIGSGLASTEAQTTQGGSAFKPFTVRNPANYPPAFVTVLFRPFPFEARSSDARISAVEGMVLIGLFLASLPKLARLPTTMRREAYSAYALVMILLFVYAFSAVGNFGILARQRTQVLPLVFVLACLPAVTRRSDGSERAADDDTTGEGDDLTRPVTAAATRRAGV